MINCHQNLFSYYREKVALPEEERTAMRKRRDSNRNSLQAGLKRDDEPAPIEQVSQGSYAMRTMNQAPDKDYDIDDGVYFSKSDLLGPNGGNKTPADAKEMVRKALHSDKFKEPVKILKNCVRVMYDAGYHVDVPVYRKIVEDENGNAIEPYFELASTNWKQSDPVAVTKWFNEHNLEYSLDTNDGGQIRRIVRYLKMFAQSRASWKGSIASGFMISKLVVDHYKGDKNRDDVALYDTIVAIQSALNSSLEIPHPTLKDEYITNGTDDARSNFLLGKLDWAIEILRDLHDPECSSESASKAWNTFFSTDFFTDINKSAPEQKAVSAAILKRGDEDSAKREAVNKGGNRRYGRGR